MYFFKLLFNPDYFPLGSDIYECRPIDENIFYKKFKKDKKNNFLKTILILDKLKDYNFTPNIINYNKNTLELYTTNCGNLLKIKNLPNDWEIQLLNIKNYLLNHNILIKDWGLWEINPFIFNNLTLKDDTIHFIDMGDAIESNKFEIDFYFNKKIKAIKLILKFGYFYLIFHYLNRIRIEIIRLHPILKLILFLYLILKYTK